MRRKERKRVWSSAAALPDGVCLLAFDHDVWVGDPAAHHGIVALGVPWHSRVCRCPFADPLGQTKRLLNQPPVLADTQVARSLLSFCAGPALLICVPRTGEYAVGHDAAVLCCLSALLSAAAATRLRVHAGSLRWGRMGYGHRIRRTLAQPVCTCHVLSSCSVRLFRCRALSQTCVLKSPARPPQMG